MTFEIKIQNMPLFSDYHANPPNHKWHLIEENRVKIQRKKKFIREHRLFHREKGVLKKITREGKTSILSCACESRVVVSSAIGTLSRDDDAANETGA